MSSDLIALIVAITLGVAVVCLGWRRNLGNTTRSWLPRFEASEQATAAFGPPVGARRRRPLSPRQRRWFVWGYLLLSLCNAALGLAADDGLFYVIIAALWALIAVAAWLKKWPPDRWAGG